MILKVCDSSSDECSEHLEVTANLLRELECEQTPVISVMNKCDLVPDIYDLPTLGRAVMISALNGEGIDELLSAIEAALPKNRVRKKLLIPFDKGSIIAEIRKDGVIHSEDYTENGTLIEATVNIQYLEKIKQYIR